jgi:hypothetical protein
MFDYLCKGLFNIGLASRFAGNYLSLRLSFGMHARLWTFIFLGWGVGLHGPFCCGVKFTSYFSFCLTSILWKLRLFSLSVKSIIFSVLSYFFRLTSDLSFYSILWNNPMVDYERLLRCLTRLGLSFCSFRL